MSALTHALFVGSRAESEFACRFTELFPDSKPVHLFSRFYYPLAIFFLLFFWDLIVIGDS
jgi:hypothetical protein